MASARQTDQVLTFEELIEATDEELTWLIRNRPWNIDIINCWSAPAQPQHPEPPQHPELPQLRLLCKRLRQQREKALAPPLPITKESHELATRSLKIHSSLGSFIARDRPRLTEPRLRSDEHRMESERTAHQLILELGGRPSYPIHRLHEIRNLEIPSSLDGIDQFRPWRHLHHLLPHTNETPAYTMNAGHDGLKVWQVFLPQLKNWERFRTWQRDHRGPNNEDTYESFILEMHRDSEFLQDHNHVYWCKKMERQPMLLMEQWEAREYNRAAYKEHGCNSFADYCEQVRRRLDSHDIPHPFQLHQDPTQQDPLTTWIEYLYYEYWWLDHYTTTLDSTQQELREKMTKACSRNIFGPKKSYLYRTKIEAKGERVSDSVDLLSQWLPYEDYEIQERRAEEGLRNARLRLERARAEIRDLRPEKEVSGCEKTEALPQLLAKVGQAEIDLERARERVLIVEELDKLSRLSHFHAEVRHWQLKLADWALSELRLVEDEVRKLPGSSDIPMIASRPRRKRVRFSEAEPTIRVFHSVPVDEGQQLDPRPELEEPQAKRLRLSQDEYPGWSGSRSGPKSLTSAIEQNASAQHDTSLLSRNGDSDAQQHQQEEDHEQSITTEQSAPPLSSYQGHVSCTRKPSAHNAEQGPLDDGGARQNTSPAPTESVTDPVQLDQQEKRNNSKPKRSRKPEVSHFRRCSARLNPVLKTLGSVWIRRSPRNMPRKK